MKFIYCFSEELKNKLMQEGYKPITFKGDMFIFENSPKLNFNFSEVDKKQFSFSNTMIF